MGGDVNRVPAELTAPGEGIGSGGLADEGDEEGWKGAERETAGFGSSFLILCGGVLFFKVLQKT